jgi:hypothetical protein
MPTQPTRGRDAARPASKRDGGDSQWVRNVLATGRLTLVTGGREVR